MMTSFDLDGYFSRRRAEVNDALAAALAARDSADATGRLAEAMRYAVLDGGKRMRPLLAVAACEAAGGAVEHALPAACAIELVHAYSLVHDDLPAMDDDRERRGKPTVWVAFGEATAILVGDALLTQAFDTLARGGLAHERSRTAEAVARLGHHAGVRGMVGGQAIDLALGQDVRDLEVLERLHAMKTGGLYAAAAAMGALCAGADDRAVDRLERYGLAFGIAFQHADDMLDDEQTALREHARVRVDALADECLTIADEFGPGAEPLRGIVRWVQERAQAAARGEKRE